MPKPFNVVVFISGRGSNLKALIDAQKAHSLPYKIVGVISDKASAPGLAHATQNGIPTTVVTRQAKTQSKEQFNTKLRDAAFSYKPDLIALAGYMRVVGHELISAFPNAIINIHPSLLPDFKGLDIHERVIASKVTIAGCSVHFVNETIDGGEILAQATVPVIADDTPDTLAARILEKEHLLYPAVIAAIAGGYLSNQNVAGRSKPIIQDNPYFPKDTCFLKANAVGNSHYQNKFL